jgi:cold-inducible RNA-binding protein
MSSKVFVGNLDFKTSKDEVQALFTQAGPINDVFLPMDRESGRPRGFAFVEYESESDAAKAIEQFNGKELNGRPLRVNAAEDRPRGAHRAGGPPPQYDNGGFGGGGGGGRGGRGAGKFPGGNPKGSRRNIRAKKRSL